MESESYQVRVEPMLISRVLLIMLAIVCVCGGTDRAQEAKSVIGKTDEKGTAARPTPTPTPPADTNCWWTPGCLDGGFGANGIVQLLPELGFTVEGLAIQGDGKTVGVARGSSGFLVLRLNSDGSLDTSFGETDPLNPTLRKGYLLENLSIGGFADVVVQPDGKIVIAAGSNDARVIRYDPVGTRDPNFGTGGMAVIPWSGLNGYVNEMKIQSNGQILVAGGALVARLNPNGSIDAGFGTNGIFSVSPNGISSLVLQTINLEERIVLAGNFKVGTRKSERWEASVLRLLPNGTTDPSFGTNGRVVTSFFTGKAGDFDAVAIDLSNRIVAGGEASDGTRTYASMARYLDNGALDTSFSGDGKATTTVFGYREWIRAGSLEIQPDGKIIGFGQTQTSSSNGQITDFLLLRFNDDGTPDGTFGPGIYGPGVVTLNVGGSDFAYAFVRQPDDGRIVITGYAGGPPYSAFFARYLP